MAISAVRRTVLLFVAPLLALPMAGAQADLDLTEIQLRTQDGVELAAPGLGEPVEIVIVLTNNGENDTSTGPIDIEVRIRDPVGVNTTQVVRTTPDRTAGGVAEAVLVWQPQRTGEHTITATLLDEEETIVMSTTVNEHAVPAGTIGERALDYPYFFIAFLASVVLFIVVVVARRQ